MTTIRPRLLTLLGLICLVAAFSAAATSPAEPPAAERLAEASEPAGEPLDPQLFTPAPQPMGDCITCVTGNATDIHWGVGANCTESLQSLQSQVNAAANAYCDSIGARAVCQSNLVITGQCWYKAMTGEYITDGYLSFGCLEGDFFCPQM